MGSEKNCQIVVKEELRGGCWYLVSTRTICTAEGWTWSS